MAVLAADVNVSVLGTPVYAPFVATTADIYYQGAIVYALAAGKVSVVPAAGCCCVGVSTKQQNVAANDLVEVLVSGIIWLPIGSGIDSNDEGDILVLDLSVLATDNPADLVAGADITPQAANDTTVGRILRATSTQMLVGITPGLTGNGYVATAGWGG